MYKVRLFISGVEECEMADKRVCMTIPQQECTETQAPVCSDVSREQCRMVPRERCAVVSTTADTGVEPRSRCRVNTRLVCEDVPREKCGNKVRNLYKLIFFVDLQYFSGSHIL